MNNKVDYIIVGGGVCGLSAALYAGRSKLNFKLFSETFGGQLNQTKIIENYPGAQSLSGYDLGNIFKKQAETFAISDNFIKEDIKEITLSQDKDFKFLVKTNSSKTWKCRFILLASGSNYRKLNIPNETELIGKGVGYCVICEGFFFKDKIVAIIGGGNSALTGALYMKEIAKTVFLINKNSQFKGEKILLEKVKKANNIKIFYNTQTIKFIGKNELEKIQISNTNTKKVELLNSQAAFIKIGMIPNTDILKIPVKTNLRNEICVNMKTFETSEINLFAAGDILDTKYKQAIISASQGSIVSLVVNDRSKK